MSPTKEEVIKRSKLHPSRVRNIYIFGSQIYGVSNYKSDWDIIIVAKTSINNQEITSGDLNMHVMTEDSFLTNLKNHNSSAIECFYSPLKLKEDTKFDWKPNLTSLRHSYSHISSNSWVKGKKKINSGEYYIGIKSIFHSLRIPMFGIQIAKTGNIYDFKVANKIYDKIMSKTWDWEDLDQEFRNQRNSILSEFRSVTIK